MHNRDLRAEGWGPEDCYPEKEDNLSVASTGYPIVVTVSPGLDLHPIEHIQLIEKQLDMALLPCGYSRSETSKGGDKVVFNYWQCAVIG